MAQGERASLVSVVVPAWNAEPWIGDTLESVLAQTWRPLEVIVVDDGSTDGTATVVEGFVDRGVRLIGQENAGQSAATNRALAEVTGDFIQFLDADDLLAPDKIERQVGRLQSEPGCVASAEWARFHGDPATARFDPEPVWRDSSPEDWLVGSWADGGGMMGTGIWLVPRAIIDRAGPFDERILLYKDREYFTRVLLASEGVRFCEGARFYYRSGLSTSQASQQSTRALRSMLLALDLSSADLLARRDDGAARLACANSYQDLVHRAYLVDNETSEAAHARVVELGGSTRRLGGGRLFRLLRRALGWKAAKRIKMLAYRAGYAHVARAKAPGHWSAG